MRGTIAKKLRREAKKERAGNPYRVLKRTEKGQLYLSITCIRSFYQRLKKIYKGG